MLLEITKSLKKPRSFLVEDGGRCKPNTQFLFPLPPYPPKPGCSFDCSAVLMPTINNGEELGLVSKGLGVESELLGV